MISITCESPIYGKQGGIEPSGQAIPPDRASCCPSDSCTAHTYGRGPLIAKIGRLSIARRYQFNESCAHSARADRMSFRIRRADGG